MIEFKKFIDAYAEVNGLQHLERSALVNSAVKHLSAVLIETENFSNVCRYIKDFIDHYDNMKLQHLELEIRMSMASGNSFFEACKEWDI